MSDLPPELLVTPQPDPYESAHAAWYDARRYGPIPEPPEAEPCWCEIGKDHDAKDTA